MKESIESGKMKAELCGATYDRAYCECLIGGHPHIADFLLVPGWSSLDHMADVPLSAMVERASGGNFPTARKFRAVVGRAGREALAGGPQIDITLTPGRLCYRWQKENIARCDEEAKKIDSSAKRTSLRSDEDGSAEAVYTLYDFAGSSSPLAVARCYARTKNISEPDAEWEFSKIRPYV